MEKNTTKRTLKECHENLKALVLTGMCNREAFNAALAAIVDIDSRLAGLRSTSKHIAESRDKLNELASKYALDHLKTVFVNGLVTDGKGVQHGDVAVDDRLYHFAAGFGAPKRLDGDNLTQEFIDGLPDAWKSAKWTIDVTGMNRMGITEEQLEKAGLFRPAKNTWTLVETGEAGE